jgi:hypothetical protein
VKQDFQADASLWGEREVFKAIAMMRNAEHLEAKIILLDNQL